MSIILSDGVKISKRNTPTREGETIQSVEDMNSIPNPYVGMRIFVLDEGVSYEVKSLRPKVVNGESIPDAEVDVYEALLSSEGVSKIKMMTESEYDAMDQEDFDNSTLYFVYKE